MIVAAAAPAGALAAGTVVTSTVTKTVTTAADPNTPVLVTEQNVPPKGYRLTATEVEKIAAATLTIRAELRRHPKAIPYEYTKGPGQWQVSWFSPGPKQVELAQAYIDDSDGSVTQVWTGFQVAWSMARGYAGAFGRRVNSWYVWIPLCVLFIAPFLPWRRRRLPDGGRERRAWSLLHLDLLALLGLSISLALFNHAKIGLSTPAIYPFMLYLLVRMLLLGFGRGRPRGPLRVSVPVSWLAIGVIFLVGFRIGLNVVNSNVIDVGYAGVIGADKLIHGHPLYGNWPKDNASGDTYGPVAYYAYVPFRMIFGWSGTWDDLPAAHAAAIVFDLLTLFGLYWLGRRVRGPDVGRGARLRVGRVPVHAMDAQLEHQRFAGRTAARARAARDHLRAGEGGGRRARGPDQVRAAGAGAAVPARDRSAAESPGDRPICARVWAHRVRRDAAGDPRQQLARVLARHDRLPGRPHLPVLDLGTVGRARRSNSTWSRAPPWRWRSR